ncbi:MAG: DUF4351 domain-containing protein [Magnetococcales bacterium]|nr:DUF4351 domain-containing protein [Magnetococcales bacterium]
MVLMLEAKKLLVEALLEVPEDQYIIMRYIVETYGSYDEQTVREIIRQVRPEEEETMMSQFAQDIISKGKPQWLQEGRQEEAVHTLLRLLQKKLGSNIPNWVGKKLEVAALEEIEAWTDRVLDAQSLDGVFSDKK